MFMIHMDHPHEGRWKEGTHRSDMKRTLSTVRKERRLGVSILVAGKGHSPVNCATRTIPTTRFEWDRWRIHVRLDPTELTQKQLVSVRIHYNNGEHVDVPVEMAGCIRSVMWDASALHPGEENTSVSVYGLCATVRPDGVAAAVTIEPILMDATSIQLLRHSTEPQAKATQQKDYRHAEISPLQGVTVLLMGAAVAALIAHRRMRPPRRNKSL
jgi:hypothetical protein